MDVFRYLRVVICLNHAWQVAVRWRSGDLIIDQAAGVVGAVVDTVLGSDLDRFLMNTGS